MGYAGQVAAKVGAHGSKHGGPGTGLNTLGVYRYKDKYKTAVYQCLYENGDIPYEKVRDLTKLHDLRKDAYDIVREDMINEQELKSKERIEHEQAQRKAAEQKAKDDAPPPPPIPRVMDNPHYKPPKEISPVVFIQNKIQHMEFDELKAMGWPAYKVRFDHEKAEKLHYYEARAILLKALITKNNMPKDTNIDPPRGRAAGITGAAKAAQPPKPPKPIELNTEPIAHKEPRKVAARAPKTDAQPSQDSVVISPRSRFTILAELDMTNEPKEHRTIGKRFIEMALSQLLASKDATIKVVVMEDPPTIEVRRVFTV